MKRWTAIVIAAYLGAMPLVGRQPAEPVRYRFVEKEVASQLGARSCKPCHEQERADFKADGVYNLIKENPGTLWNTVDPHSKAASQLDPKTNPIAARMARELKLTNVQQTAECLTCHAIDHKPAENTANKTFAWSSGVSCEGCHGVAFGWDTPHKVETWRTTPMADKEKLGWSDLRDPAKRAAKCASCHVGNLAEGKFVTHAMYAAGHPPLLPFEPATFGKDQPAHWRPPEDVPYFKAKPDDASKFLHYRPDEPSVLRDLVAGSLVNLRETVRLLEQDAAAPGKPLDFAHFDCFACHHDLRTDGTRQKVGYGNGIPGRPPMRYLPTELVQQVLPLLENAELAGQLATKTTELRAAFDARPFGDPQQIRTAAQGIVQWSDQCLAKLDALKLPMAAKAELAARLRAIKRPSDGWDYDTAQQFTWALRMLEGDGVAAPLREWVLPSAGLPTQYDPFELFNKRLTLRYGFPSAKFAAAWSAR